MEQNTNRMWWTIGLIVLGGLLIGGFMAIANTNVMPQLSNKANALFSKRLYKHTAYAFSSDGKSAFTTNDPNWNLLTGTKDFTGDWKNTNGWTTRTSETLRVGVNSFVIKQFNGPTTNSKSLHSSDSYDKDTPMSIHGEDLSPFCFYSI